MARGVSVLLPQHHPQQQAVLVTAFSHWRRWNQCQLWQPLSGQRLGQLPDFQFGQSAPETVLEQVAEATNSNNMTQEGVDLAATFEKGSSEQTNNVAEQMQQATQGMTAQGFKKEGFTKPLGT